MEDLNRKIHKIIALFNLYEKYGIELGNAFAEFLFTDEFSFSG